MRCLEFFKTSFLQVEIEKREVQKFTVTKMYDLKIFNRFMNVRTDKCIYTKCEILSQIHLFKTTAF